MFLEQFIKLIEFDVMNPQGIIRLFFPDFDLAELIGGVKDNMVSEDEGVSFLDEMKMYVLAGGAFILFVVLLLVLSFFWRSKILPKLK